MLGSIAGRAQSDVAGNSDGIDAKDGRMRIEAPDRVQSRGSRCGRDCATCAARLCAPDKPEAGAGSRQPDLDKATPPRA